MKTALLLLGLAVAVTGTAVDDMCNAINEWPDDIGTLLVNGATAPCDEPPAPPLPRHLAPRVPRRAG